MSSRREHQQVVYSCDNPDCNLKYKARTRAFSVGWRLAKSVGWIAANIDGKWLHFCCWVHRPQTDEQLRRLVERPDLNPREVRHDTATTPAAESTADNLAPSASASGAPKACADIQSTPKVK